MEKTQKYTAIQVAKIIALVLTFGAYFFVPYQMISKSEKVLKEGTVFRFKPRPIDPGDIFRGRYVRLDFNANRIPYKDANKKFTFDQKVFATVAIDSAGYGYFDGVFESAPTHTHDYIETYIESYNIEDVWVHIPFSKYYLNENIALDAENTARELMRDRDTVRVYMDVRVKDGESGIEELYFDGVPVVEYVKGK